MTGVVLFQLGGPDSLDSVGPFLTNLFSDPDIIDFPGAFLARKPLARFISSRRSPVVAAHYREIGGRSPILELTNAQASALERELSARMEARVFVAMRYWHPFTSETIAAMQREAISDIVLLPLYPQYSRATTLSSFKEWRKRCGETGYVGLPARSVCCYFDHPLYIDSIVDNVARSLSRIAIPAPEIDLVFSAHGVPVGLIRKGDPYRLHIQETVRLVLARGGWTSPHVLCYQSKVGPAEWLKPSLAETMRALASRGRRHLLVIPVAFVTEHIETLHEINIEAREEAHRLGFETFEMMPALNDHPLFIACLADLVRSAAANGAPGAGGCPAASRAGGEGVPLLCPSGR